jgi:hypothetical protein
MKTKRNKKFVTNKRKKNKKLINKSFKKYKNNNKNFSRKYRQKGGTGVYDKIRLNIKDIRDCIGELTQGPIHYDPIKNDYEPSINRAIKSASTVLTFNSKPKLNCIDTLKYYNTAKLSFVELENYLQFYKIYSENFGMDETLNLYLLGYLYIFHELYYRISNIQNMSELFSSVHPILIESFVCKDPDNNFFWVNYYKAKTFSSVREKGQQIADTARSKIKGLEFQEAHTASSLPFKIRRVYTDYITLKNTRQLVRIFQEYIPYYSPIDYLGNDSDRNTVSRDGFNFKIKNLENIDDLLNKNNYRFIRNFGNVRLLTESPLFQDLTTQRINFKWDLTFDIPYDNTNLNNNLNVIHNFYNENRNEDISSFFKDSFIRTREFICIEKNGEVQLMDEPDIYESIYKFLLVLSELSSQENYNFGLFKTEFDKNKEKLRYDLLRVILSRIGFPEYNIQLCLKNLTNYIKAYFLSKNPYLFDCINIKTVVFPDFVNVYGVFSSYTDENKINNGQIQTNISSNITWRNSESKSDMIEIINRFVLSNTENKLSRFSKHGNEANDISCESAFYNVIENGRQRGFGASLFNLICIGSNGQLILAYIIQVTIYSKNDNEDISDFQLKYLLIWNNKDDVVYQEIDYIDITENFRNCFLKPIFTPLTEPLRDPETMPRINIENTGPSGWKNFKGIFSRKPSEEIPTYDQSQIRDFPIDVPKLPPNNQQMAARVVDINQPTETSSRFGKTLKNLFSRSKPSMPANYDNQPNQLNQPNQPNYISGIPGKYVSGQIVLGGKKYKTNTKKNIRKSKK